MTLKRVEGNEMYPVWTLEEFDPKYNRSRRAVRDISPELLARYTRIMAEWEALQKELDALVERKKVQP